MAMKTSLENKHLANDDYFMIIAFTSTFSIRRRIMLTYQLLCHIYQKLYRQDYREYVIGLRYKIWLRSIFKSRYAIYVNLKLYLCKIIISTVLYLCKIIISTSLYPPRLAFAIYRLEWFFCNYAAIIIIIIINYNK